MIDCSQLVEFVLKRFSRIDIIKISGRRVRVRLPKFSLLTQTSPPTKIWNFANFTKYQSCKTKQTTQMIDCSQLVEFVLKRFSRIDIIKISGRRVRVRLPKFSLLTQTSPPTKIWNFAKFTKYQTHQTKQPTQSTN